MPAQHTDLGRGGSVTRTIARMVALAAAVGLAVIGLAAPSSAHHNTITGAVSCREGGGWLVTWRVVNSEQRTETVTGTNRAVVPAGTVFGPAQARSFQETVTTKPGSPLTLTLAARWSNNVTATNSGSIAVAAFSDGCNVTRVDAPSIPVVDDCGPGNAHYGTVPTGPWTSVTNPDGSVTVTAQQGHVFSNGQTVITYPVPTDSNVACPTPPATPPTPPTTPPTTTPPTTTPPVTPPEVLPAEVRIVRAAARHIDKCGRRSDLFKVGKRSGITYTANGKVVRQGVWLKARTRTVTIRAVSSDAGVELRGRHVWKVKFSARSCSRAPEIAPETGQ